jgi:hypothetical protein
MEILVYFSRFGISYQEKSGSPFRSYMLLSWRFCQRKKNTGSRKNDLAYSVIAEKMAFPIGCHCSRDDQIMRNATIWEKIP